jgi:hypothetical protein
MMPRRFWIALGLAMVVGPALAINKCVDKSGKVTYQEDKCPDDSKQDALKTPIAAPKAAPRTPAVEEDPGNDAVLRLASDRATLDSCEEAAPGFLVQYREDVDAWRAFHAKALARDEQTPRYRELVDRGRSQLRDQMLRIPGAGEKIGRFCHAQFIPALRRTIGKS